MSTVKLVCLLDDHSRDYAYSVSFPLDLTFGELFDCVENYHDWLSGCPCQATPARDAWITSLTTTPHDIYEASSLALLPTRRYLREDSIRSMAANIASSRIVHLQIESKMRPRPQPTPSFFKQAQVGPSIALKCGPFDRFCIHPASQSFMELYSTPGSVLVDKTSFVNPMRLHAISPYVVIRRPPGFGKTTFLSMMASYVDIEACVAPNYFQAVGVIPEELLAHDCQQQLVVVSLDLGRLDLSGAEDDESLLARCETFMDEELCRDVERYRPILHPTNNPDFDDITCAWSLIDRLRTLRINVMIIVDNYTSPFKGLAADRRAQIERVTYHSIAEWLVTLIECGLVRRSYVVGQDLVPGEPLPWSNQFAFHELFEDLTESTAADAAFGLCALEVRALWKVAFPQHDNMPDPLSFVDPAATEADGRRYSIRGALDILSDLQLCESDAERIAFQPKARIAFTTLQPEYTLYLSDSNTPLLLARADCNTTDWAPRYDPPTRFVEELIPEPWAEHYAMLARRNEVLRLLDEDPTANFPGVIRLKPDPIDHLPAIRDGVGEMSHQLMGSRQSAEPGGCLDVDASSPSQLAALNARPEAKIDLSCQLSHEDSGSDRASIIGSDHREDSNASSAPTSVASPFNSSPRSSRSSKRSRDEKDENEPGSDTAEDVSADSSDGDRSSSERSVRRRLPFDSTPGSP